MATTIEVKAPSLGESESEATVVRLLKQPGEPVAEGETIAEIESDKITMELPAPAGGVLRAWRKREGEVVRPGEVMAEIEPGEPPKKASESAEKTGKSDDDAEKVEGPEESEGHSPGDEVKKEDEIDKPAEKRGVFEPASEPAPPAVAAAARAEERRPMSPIRRRIARRLKEAQNTAAMLTTFNEADMSAVLALKRRWGEAFAERHGVKLGLTSFFVYAVCRALRRHPLLNARIEGDEVVQPNFVDCGIAVATERGLLVPVIRDAHRKGLVEIERAIHDLAARARDGRLSPDDLAGGTFSITNGGVFGSMLSTPILNPPQSAILGLHAVKERPVAVDGRVEIRPMMYLALSYDHRLIDGADAVRFLVEVRNWIEHPGLAWLEL